jgi:hypothetical protein
MVTVSPKPRNTNVVLKSSDSEGLIIERFIGKDVYETLGKVLYAKGLIDSPTPESPAARLGTESDYGAVTAGSGQSKISFWSGVLLLALLILCVSLRLLGK